MQQPPAALGPPVGVEQRTPVDPTGLFRGPIEASLSLLPVQLGDVRLVWAFMIATLDQRHAFEFTMDAVNGQVLTRFDHIRRSSYKVFPLPLESPRVAVPPPPADGRTVEVDPAFPPVAIDRTASPKGWHDTDGVDGADYTTLNGNR